PWPNSARATRWTAATASTKPAATMGRAFSTLWRTSRSSSRDPAARCACERRKRSAAKMKNPVLGDLFHWFLSGQRDLPKNSCAFWTPFAQRLRDMGGAKLLERRNERQDAKFDGVGTAHHQRRRRAMPTLHRHPKSSESICFGVPNKPTARAVALIGAHFGARRMNKCLAVNQNLAFSARLVLKKQS